MLTDSMTDIDRLNNTTQSSLNSTQLIIHTTIAIINKNSGLSFAAQHFIMAVIAIVGLAGNCTACHVIVTSRAIRRTLSSGFLLNQSVVDLLTCSAALCDMAVWRWLPNQDLSGWTGTLLCWFVYGRFAFNSLVSVSTYNMLALTAERAISVIWPVLHRSKVTKKVVFASVMIAWAIGVGLIAFSLPPTSGVRQGKCLNWAIFRGGDIYRRMFGIADLMFTYAIPLVVIGVCYYAIYTTVFSRKAMSKGKLAVNKNTICHPKNNASNEHSDQIYTDSDTQPTTLRKSPVINKIIDKKEIKLEHSNITEENISISISDIANVDCSEHIGSGKVNKSFDSISVKIQDAHNENVNHVAIKSHTTSKICSRRTSALRTMLSIVACYVICNSLHHMIVILSKFGVHIPGEDILTEVGVVLMFLNAAANPIIYTFQYRDYQRALLKIARSWCNSNNRVVMSNNTVNTENTRTGICGQLIDIIQIRFGLTSTLAPDRKYDIRTNSSTDIDISENNY